MDEYEKYLEKHIADMKNYPEENSGRSMLKMALHEYRAFKAKAESPAINGLEVTVCPKCGTPIKRCEGCPPMPFKAKAEEPLAVLADRNGAKIGGISLQKDGWVINIDLPHIYDCECVVAPTYYAAEAKARAYLEGLDDVREGKK
jgi:hypothetical protein